MKRTISQIAFLPMLFLSSLVFFSCVSNGPQEGESDETGESASVDLKLIQKDQDKKVEVLIDGKLFTSYIYPDNIAKPVLYPLITQSGKVLTRGFPLDPMPGERVDHPHHVGHWLNYGDVNELDFWNNSEAIPAEKKHRYGSIRHEEVVSASSTDGIGVLKVGAHWDNPSGKTLLNEATQFTFSQEGNTRIIDRITTLTAAEEKVSFTDNKEGMIAIRVTRALELPSDSPAIFTDADGNPTEVKALNNEGVNGDYLSSEGITGGDVWGTRAKWMKLFSQIEGDPVALVIIDHPDNVGYPTYWHARGYGLFSANPLGQKVFSKGKEELNFALEPGESVTFKYRILVHGGEELSKEEIERYSNDFENE